MRNLKVVFAIVLLAAVLCSCGATPTPAATLVPATPPALVVKGMVDKELGLTLDALKALGMTKVNVEHPKNGPTDYEGVLLNILLEQAGAQAGATTAVLTASDGFSAEVPVADIKACSKCMVAVDGSALNMVMDGMSSKMWVKNVVSIEFK
jgi:hypothetical protein